ncbi:MAG: M20/M25/M40 family metallo-hydrolase [Candidatus Acidiferrales bacterium]
MPGRNALRFAFPFLVFAAVLLAGSAPAQLPPLKSSPLEQRVPQGSGACSVQTSCAEVAPAIIQRALGISPLEENLRNLTDVVGGRVTGTDAADRAVGFAVEALRRAGVDEVHTEKFTIPSGWSEGHTHVDVLAPQPFPVRLVSIGWSPPTPDGGITAAVVDVGMGDDAGFARAGAAAKDAIVLVHSDFLTTWEGLEKEYDVAPEIIRRAQKAGAAAIFWMSSRPSLLLYRHTSASIGDTEPLPQAVVAREDAERMARFIAAGQKVRVHLDMPNRLTGPVESENVVGEIRGREQAGEFVLLGAHLDSWDLGTGALDNGCNVALVIDAARAIHASGTIPRRSIRFVLFTGEEQGMLGSWAYAKAHRVELDRMIAAVVLDSGDGAVTGYSLSGRTDILDAVKSTLAPVAPLGAREFTFDASADTDNFDFLLEGVPTLVANQEPSNYMLNYHAASDTFDKVNIAQVKKNTAIAAVTVYALADAEERIGPRESRAEIEQLLKKSGLEDSMKEGPLWDLWLKSDRGREP